MAGERVVEAVSLTVKPSYDGMFATTVRVFFKGGNGRESAEEIAAVLRDAADFILRPAKDLTPRVNATDPDWVAKIRKGIG